MDFRDLQGRLLDLARRRIRNGVVSERGLARLSGLSQPHVHNALKKIRVLSLDSTDRLMEALQLRVGDLLGAPAGLADDADFTFVPVPFLRGRIGPGAQPVFDVYRGYYPVIASLASGLVDPVVARLAPDMVLPGACAAADVVLLDQNPAARVRPTSGVWVVSKGTFGMRVRYVRLKGGKLYVFHEANAGEPELWTATPLAGRNILDVVRARVVWLGRELPLEAPAGPDAGTSTD